MKAIFNLKKSIMYVAAVAAMFSMVSCDDDDDPKPLVVTDVNGLYQGTLQVMGVLQRESSLPAATVDAKVETEKINFTKFPVEGLIAAIEEQEAVAEILEGMEDVTYEMEYTAKLNAAQDSIYLTFAPKPLEFEYTKTEGEGEEAEEVTTNIKVTLKGSENGGAYSDKNLELNMEAEEIKINDVAIESFTPLHLRILLKKK